MEPIEVYRGEKRFVAAELAALLAEGDSLAEPVSVEVVAKRGRTATTLVVSTPTAPAIDGTQVEFWVDVPDDQTRGNYLALVTCATVGEETLTVEAPLLVL